MIVEPGKASTAVPLSASFRRRSFGAAAAMAVAVTYALAMGPAAGHDLYLMNDNHTDYGWNASPEALDQAMLNELDYYLDQIARAADRPAEEQPRFAADCWWYLYNYQQHRSPDQFQRLIAAMRSGHISVPLNPLVQLYGAMPTEAAIRAGYYPGRIERQYGVAFRRAQNIENHTSPWGLASLWAGSGADVTWKGVCGCATDAPYRDHAVDLFRWQGPDDKELLMKWYAFEGDRTRGGYAEAREISSMASLASALAQAKAQTPAVPLTGLFGIGHDDVVSLTDAPSRLAAEWRQSGTPEDRVIVSNGIDFFDALRPHVHRLPVLRGGWGNDWDLWPAALSAETRQIRAAVERLRTAEALSAVAALFEPSFWPPVQSLLEGGWMAVFKYFEHSWGATSDPLFEALVANKKAWAGAMEAAVATADGLAEGAVARLFSTPDEERFAVFNPLAFTRTDIVEIPVVADREVTVIDVASGEAVPSQEVSIDGRNRLRILAREVPALGYRVYRLAPGPGQPWMDAATRLGSGLENGRFRVRLGASGEIVSLFDKEAGREMAGGALNAFSAGGVAGPPSFEIGPVSATVRVAVAGTPRRSVAVTLYDRIGRVDIANEILQNATQLAHYDFTVNLDAPRIRFEEIGAIARPGLAADGGDFLPGTRADYMTLNHFVSFAGDDYAMMLANRDGFLMGIGASTPDRFDLPTRKVRVLAVGNPARSRIEDQGGAVRFVHRFALFGRNGSVSDAEAMRIGLAHANPLRAIALNRNQRGPLVEPVFGFLSVDGGNVVVTAVKPAEEADRGIILRLWELGGQRASVGVDVSQFRPSAAFETSLIETDRAPAALEGGRLTAVLAANEIKTYRLLPTRRP